MYQEISADPSVIDFFNFFWALFRDKTVLPVLLSTSGGTINISRFGLYTTGCKDLTGVFNSFVK